VFGRLLPVIRGPSACRWVWLSTCYQEIRGLPLTSEGAPATSIGPQWTTLAVLRERATKTG